MDPDTHMEEEDSELSVEPEEGDALDDENNENIGSYSWVLSSFPKITQKRVESKPFEAAGHKWETILFPRGNRYAGVLSCFLNLRPDTFPSSGWSCTAKFSFTILNHKDGSRSVVKSTTHRYTKQSGDWGFNQIVNYAEATDPSAGFLDSNGDLTIKVDIEVIPGSGLYGSGSSYYVSWDSKKETGYVGLKNQGATCYMNSLLQSLYSLSTFRKAVYEMPTQDDSPTSSIPLALQRVFYNLQFSDRSVGTKELTTSFGWSRSDSFVQQDVQELNRVFCDNLEEKMKGTSSEGIIQRLFEGKLTNFIRCVNVDFESKRQETFLDLSLQIQGCANVYESFEKYTAPERLEGDNQYKTDDFGLQDADMGCNFTELPPVLELHLKRFIFDYNLERNVKINDKYEYPSLLRLDRFMHPDADRSIKYNYRLHCVLVHSGDVHGGHYYAYIRPTTKNQWYKFDDTRVTKATTKQVFETNFGGEVPYTQYRYGAKTTVMRKKKANAYMLIYVRTSVRDQMFEEVLERDIPPHLKERFEREEEERVKREQEQRDAHKYTRVKVATVADMEKHHMVDLVEMDDVPTFKVLKDSTLKEFRKTLAEAFSVPVERQRFWSWQSRRNNTIRPDALFSPRDEESPLYKILKRSELKLFLEISNAPEGTTEPDKLFPPVPSDRCILFLKTYDPSVSRLDFLTYTFVSVKSTVGELIPLVKESMGWGGDAEVMVFEEIKPSMIEKVDPSSTIRGAELGNGDILTFQRVISDGDDREDWPHPLATDHYHYMLNRVQVEFRDLANPKLKTSMFTLELFKDMSYAQVAAAAAEKLECDPMKLRFTQQNGMQNGPRLQPVKPSTHPKLLDLLYNSYSRSKLMSVLYYEPLEYSITEYETKRIIKVSWFDDHVTKVSTEKLLLERTAKVSDVIEALSKKMELKGTGKIRILDVHNHKIYRTLRADERLSGVSHYTTMRGEEIPLDELEKNPTSQRVQVVHICKDGGRHHFFSDPFFFMIRKGETFDLTKERLIEKLGLTKEDVAKYKFGILPGYVGRLKYLKDDSVLSDHKWYSTDQLALEHADKARTPRSTSVGIVIKG